VVVGLDDEIELGEHAGGVAFDGLLVEVELPGDGAV
jgi:hypothetical protein